MDFNLQNFLADYGLKWVGEKDLAKEDLEDDVDDYDNDSDNQSFASTSRADNDDQVKFTYANKFYYPGSNLNDNTDNSKKSNYKLQTIFYLCHYVFLES